MANSDLFNSLKENIKKEKKIIKELQNFVNYVDFAKPGERRIITSTINSLKEQLRILNNANYSILQMLFGGKAVKPEVFAETKQKTKKDLELESIPYESVSYAASYTMPSKKVSKGIITIKKEDREKLIKELNFSEEVLKKLRKGEKKKKERKKKSKKPKAFAKMSNNLFLNTSTKMINEGKFRSLDRHLRKASFPYLLNTYVSMVFFATLITFFLAFFLLIIFLFFKLSYEFPFFLRTEEGILMRLFKNFWIIFVLPALTFISFYFYPSTESKTVGKKIDQELPFVTIHLSAIARSRIEPSKIFSIIASSSEYINTKKEIIKLINQINVYGYDIVNALRNCAKTSPSKKLSELFNGIATTISTGGGLTEFFDKRAETLLFDYKLERERYTKLTETFMNIYISIIIAAPLILILLMIMMNITGMGFGMSMGMLTLLIILGIALINVLFLIILHVKQPKF